MDNSSIESAFVPKITETEVREYFERRKKGGIFGEREEIAEIEGGYFPLGIFDVTWVEEIKEGILSPIVSPKFL